MNFPQENRCFEDPAVVVYYCRTVLLPRSEGTMTIVFLVWQGFGGSRES